MHASDGGAYHLTVSEPLKPPSATTILLISVTRPSMASSLKRYAYSLSSMRPARVVHTVQSGIRVPGQGRVARERGGARWEAHPACAAPEASSS